MMYYFKIIMSRFYFQMSLSIFVVFALFGVTIGDKPSSGYGAPSIPQVKYGGPIVYSAEKPPIIHFPPPPAEVS